MKAATLDFDETPDKPTELKRQVANLKSMMNKLIEIPKNKTGGASQTKSKENTPPFNPHLISKLPITTDQGPFCDVKLPVQCHTFHGWGHTWMNWPTSSNLVWDENSEQPLFQKWRASNPMMNLREINCLRVEELQIQTTLNSRLQAKADHRGEGESNFEELGD